MGLKGKTPETGSRGLTFTHDKCHGKPRTGWLSGDVHVLECHVGEGKSKPCERVLLGTNAPCEGCKNRRAFEPLGFVPLRDQTGRPTCVLVRKDRIAFVANLERGLSVYYGKDEGRFESVYVIPSLKELAWEKYFTQSPADDMSYWLPKFLGTPHLAAAMRALFRGELECHRVVTQEAPAPVPAVESLPPTTEQLEGVGDALPFAVALSDTTRRIDAKNERAKRNAAFVSKNGKG